MGNRIPDLHWNPLRIFFGVVRGIYRIRLARGKAFRENFSMHCI